MHKIFYMYLKLNLAFLFLFFSLQTFGQDREISAVNEEKSQINYYTQFTMGLTNPIYRDFATSPLFYSGVGINLNSTWLKRSDERERLFEVGFGISAQSPRVPESKFIQSGGLAGFGQFSFIYQELWKLDVLSNAKNNTKIGGLFITTQNIRANAALQNNAMGLENFTNLMASAQWTRDISRTETKQLNLWIFKPTLKPVKRDLRLLLNVGVLNFNYRPGYAYSYDSEMNGMETNPVSWVFSNYKWSINGFRLKTQLEYITYLPNGNARSLSYVWEAAHAPGKHEAFQMASHRIQYTIHFHTKKR